MSRTPASRQQRQTQPYVLLRSRAESDADLLRRIDLGRELQHRVITNSSDYDDVWEDYSRWSDYNRELLKRMFSSDEVCVEYDRPSGALISLGPTSLKQDIEDLFTMIRASVNRLESIRERLAIIEAPDLANDLYADPTAESNEDAKGVFVVHGHDEEMKQSVARMLTMVDLHPIVLHEMPDRGRTIIEKIEAHSSVRFAIILLSPDDLGKALEDPEFKPRARQNVIFELGYFFGKLGRSRVCALHRGNVEILSDFAGVLWKLYDEHGAWRYEIAKELKAAGLDLDFERLIES